VTASSSFLSIDLLAFGRSILPTMLCLRGMIRQVLLSLEDLEFVTFIKAAGSRTASTSASSWPFRWWNILHIPSASWISEPMSWFRSWKMSCSLAFTSSEASPSATVLDVNSSSSRNLQFGMRRGYYLEYLEPTRMNQVSNGGIINKLTKLQDVYLFQVDLIKLSRHQRKLLPCQLSRCWDGCWNNKCIGSLRLTFLFFWEGTWLNWCSSISWLCLDDGDWCLVRHRENHKYQWLPWDFSRNCVTWGAGSDGDDESDKTSIAGVINVSRLVDGGVDARVDGTCVDKNEFSV
jgi:hypothetical protein